MPGSMDYALDFIYIIRTSSSPFLILDRGWAVVFATVGFLFTSFSGKFFFPCLGVGFRDFFRVK